LLDLTGAFNKQLHDRERVKPTDTFSKGYDKAIKSLSLMENVWIGFETLNRPDIDEIVTQSLWRVWDEV
jgi:hypothetical protein